MNNQLYILLVAALVACVTAAPKPQAAVVDASIVYSAPSVVTATSSQVIARNYNGFAVAAPYVVAADYVAPYAASYVAPYVAAPAVEPVYYI